MFRGCPHAKSEQQWALGFRDGVFPAPSNLFTSTNLDVYQYVLSNESSILPAESSLMKQKFKKQFCMLARTNMYLCVSDLGCFELPGVVQLSNVNSYGVGPWLRSALMQSLKSQRLCCTICQVPVLPF